MLIYYSNLMAKPVNKLQFWKDRIDTAVKPHYSVYVVHEHGWKLIYQHHVSIIDKVIDKTEKVLDAGCGYGRMAVCFTKEKYTGVDFSPDFIELAKQNNSDYKFLVADMKDLPFKDNEFDWSFCISIKKMICDNLGEEEWNNMLKELKRVSKKVLILEYEDPTTYEIL